MSNGIIGVMQQKGIWRAYEEQVVGLEPILLDMSARGMPINPEAFAQVHALLTAKRDEAAAHMQTLVPPEVRRFKSYKRGPKVVTSAHFQVDVADAGTGETRKEWRMWLEWKPSNKGLVAYMVHRKHEVPRNFKTGKDTTQGIEIIRLYNKTKDPLYKTVIEYRKASTVLNNHMENWQPGSDGRVHSVFYFDPATGQLSSRRPNVQNAPKHDDPEFGGFAKVFRSMVKARPGHVILEFDYKSFHAQTLAFEAEDADYLRLAKLDIHSFLTARLIRDPKAEICLGWDDAALGEYLAWIKKNNKFIRDYKAKRAILGYGFGLGYRRLYDMNKESFDSQRDAKKVLDTLDATFPVTKAWRDTIKQKAHEQGHLISRWGFIRYFWEVFTFKGGQWRPGGDDAERAIAFLPANSAFGHMRWAMREIERQGLAERFGLINNVHDSLVFECPEDGVDNAMVIKDIMELPSNVLINKICPNGLAVEVDAQCGPDWSSMKGIQ